jgi:hypothetical protein
MDTSQEYPAETNILWKYGVVDFPVGVVAGVVGLVVGVVAITGVLCYANRTGLSTMHEHVRYIDVAVCLASLLTNNVVVVETAITGCASP